jgi:hypothetical protein
MRRLFVFGCSFTSYIWPTWADMLSFEYDHYENWAIAGLGNRGILERLVECHTKNKFTKDDTIIVQWSSHVRYDWYSEATEDGKIVGWAVNRIKGPVSKYKKCFDQIYSDKAYALHTLNFISLAQNLLKQSECCWFMTSLGDIRNLGYDNVFSKKPIEDITISAVKWELWQRFPELKIYESIWTDNTENWIDPIFPFVIKNKDKIWKFNKDNYLDLHPTPEIHNLWLNQKLKPKLSIEYNYDYIRETMSEKSQMLKQATDCTLDDFSEALEKLFIKMFETLPVNFPGIEKKIGF